MKIGQLNFKEIWIVDFEFIARPGDRQQPICLVAWEIKSGKRYKIWQDHLIKMKLPPYSLDRNSLFVAYYASAEIGCHLSLGWPLPENILDLFVEFRNITNGLPVPCGNGLLGALVQFGLRSIDAVTKDSMRELVMTGGPWSQKEQSDILDYCESDVDSLSKLLNKISHKLDMPRALLRGRYMKSAAHIEYQGIPIDLGTLQNFRKYWKQIQGLLIDNINKDYDVFDGPTFKEKKFVSWLNAKNIPWPLLDSGKLDLSDNAFRDMARSSPLVAPLRELRITLSRMRLSKLAVGRDGRNRCLLSAFQARTSRNQPSNSKFIFGPAVWLRGLIKPKPGSGLAYIDWSQQEFAIAAVLSDDTNMIEAYKTGDPYLAFAKQAGAVPPEGTKEIYYNEREQFKACVLAVQYGMGPESLAKRINQPVIKAKEILSLHRDTYKNFWKWSDGIVDYAMLYGILWTTFGWTIHIGTNVNPRSLRNFPMQANGAEMLRLACCYTIERGIKICAPVHDAILIESPLIEIDNAIMITRQAMAAASADVLDGFELRTDVEVIKYPDRYEDPRGKEMWNKIKDILAEIQK